MIQAGFRSQVRELANAEGWARKVPRPVRPQTILYGDKIINVINQRRRDVWPKPVSEAYIANGDIGVVVGEYKTRKFRGLLGRATCEYSCRRHRTSRKSERSQVASWGGCRTIRSCAAASRSRSWHGTVPSVTCRPPQH
jgi:hypothetical protein